MDKLIFSSDPTQVLGAINYVDQVLLISFAACFLLLTVGGWRAPYGRYSSEGRGPYLPGIVDWYMHSTALVGVAMSMAIDKFDARSRPKAALLLAFFSVHYFQRSFLFAWQMDPKKIKPIPLFVLLSGSGFCLVNGFLNARYLTLIASEQSLNNIQFLLGSALWLLGFYGNIWHDRRLLELKRKSGGVYVIPTGGLFEYVSGANFLCEIIEWFGYAVAANFSLPATGFFIMTALNIGPRAWHHHNYYLERFPEYPKSRKSLIPFVI